MLSFQMSFILFLHIYCYAVLRSENPHFSRREFYRCAVQALDKTRADVKGIKRTSITPHQCGCSFYRMWANKVISLRVPTTLLLLWSTWSQDFFLNPLPLTWHLLYQQGILSPSPGMFSPCSVCSMCLCTVSDTCILYPHSSWDICQIGRF